MHCFHKTTKWTFFHKGTGFKDQKSFSTLVRRAIFCSMALLVLSVSSSSMRISSSTWITLQNKQTHASAVNTTSLTPKDQLPGRCATGTLPSDWLVLSASACRWLAVAAGRDGRPAGIPAVGGTRRPHCAACPPRLWRRMKGDAGIQTWCKMLGGLRITLNQRKHTLWGFWSHGCDPLSLIGGTQSTYLRRNGHHSNIRSWQGSI